MLPEKPVMKPLSNFLPGLLLSAGVVALLVGLYLGEPEKIFDKAVMVCLECIGIG